MSKIKSSEAASALGRKSARQHPQKRDVLDKLEETEKKQWSLLVPASLHKRMKIHAVMKGRDVKSIIIELVEKYLAEQKS